MIFLDKFRLWMNGPEDRVEMAWQKRGRKMARIVFEYEDGERRELAGDAADEWWHDLHRANCGRRPDWSRHKWSVTSPNKAIPSTQ